MAKQINKPVRLDARFTRDFIQDIQMQKRKRDPQCPAPTPSRISLAIARHPLSGKIKKDIIEADLQ